MPLPTNLSVRRPGVTGTSNPESPDQSPPVSPGAARSVANAQQYAALQRPTGQGPQRAGQFTAPETTLRTTLTARNAPHDPLFAQSLAQWASSGCLTERSSRRIAVHLIEDAHRQNAPLLDLSGLKLSTLPNGLENLHAVTSLTVADNMLLELPPLPPSLLHLDLSCNQFFEAPVLPNNLEMLNFDGNGSTPSRPDLVAAMVCYQAEVEALPYHSRIAQAWGGHFENDSPTLDFRRVVAAAGRNSAPASSTASPTASDIAAAHAAFNLSAPYEFPLEMSGRDNFSESGNSTPRTSGLVQLSEFMMKWHPADNIENPETTARWQQIAAEENAPEFTEFLSKLTGAADYTNPALRDAFVKNVGEVMTEVLNSDKFRQTCFAIALDLTETCHDGIALGLNNMTLALIDHKAEAGRYSQAELHDIGRNSFRINVIDQITSKKVVELEKIYAANPIRANKVDPVEVRLAYQTGLAQEFELKGVVSDMLYHYDSKLTLSDLTVAAAEIRRQEVAGGDVTFLAEWSPWQKAMQRSNPESFKRYEANRDDEREWLACQPETMTDGAYLDALADQKKHAEQGLILFTKRHTWQFMDAQSTT